MSADKYDNCPDTKTPTVQPLENILVVEELCDLSCSLTGASGLPDYVWERMSSQESIEPSRPILGLAHVIRRFKRVSGGQSA